MRTGAEVGKIPLAVEADALALTGMLLNQLDFVGLVLHQLERLGRLEGKALERERGLDDLRHLGLDLFEILGGKRGGNVKVVVKTVVNRRTDGELRLREEMLHRLGQNVRGGVPEGALAVLILKGEDFERAVGLEREAQIAHLAVYPARAGGLC